MAKPNVSEIALWIGGIITAAFVLIMFILFAASGAGATWKPEYGKNPESVQQWFREQQVMREAQPRLGGIQGCCDHADRFMTKFVAGADHDWSYYTDSACTEKGCPLANIPNDIVHPEPITSPDPKDNDLPEFKAMRREGVLFVYRGHPTCFWPPESGI